MGAGKGRARRRLKWLAICDEFSRGLVALEVERRMEAKDVIRILDEAVMARGSAPEFIRSDNGPEFVALAASNIASGTTTNGRIPHWTTRPQ